MERIFRTTQEIEDFVVTTTNKVSGINWEYADSHSVDDVRDMLEQANEYVAVFERAYNILADTNDPEIAEAVDVIMVRLADAYLNRHTFQTVYSVRRIFSEGV